MWLYGGLVYSKLGNAQDLLYLGWVVLFLYLPFYWYRTRIEDPKVAGSLAARPQFAAGPGTPIVGK